MLINSSIFITGNARYLGNTFISIALDKYNHIRLLIYSCNTMKQWINFFTGNFRRDDRLPRRLDSIDYAASTKIAPIAEYNPFKCAGVRINGTINLINQA